MIKTQIIGHLAHDNKLFDVHCQSCGTILNSREINGACPKCGNAVSPILAGNQRAMAISEGTIYPTMTDDDKKRDAENVTKRKNGMAVMYRFVIFSFANKETGVLVEPPVHRYLTKGREIMIEVNHNPVVSWYKAGDDSIKCEIKFVIMSNEGDKIALLGKKEVIDQPIAKEAIGVQSPPNADVATQLANLQSQLNALIAAQTGKSVAQPDSVTKVAAVGDDFDPFANAQ